MKWTHSLFITLFLGSTFCVNATQITVDIDLPDLVGTYTEGQPARSADFDLETQFSSIESASIAITGTGTPGVMEVCLAAEPSNCTNEVTSPELFYSFVFETSKGTAPFGRVGPFTDPPPQTFVDDLIKPLTSLDFLLDGAGTLRLQNEIFVCAAIYTCSPLALSQVEVSSETVRLSVTGTPITEPSILILYTLGLIALIFSGKTIDLSSRNILTRRYHLL